MRKLLLTSAALPLLSLSALSSPVLAAEALDEVVVTATRLPTAPDLVTGARVVAREDLAARQTPFLADVLSTIPGVSIARTGAFGGIGAIRIRGASPDKTLVLIDGVPAGDPADPAGAFDPGSLQTADLERIEVLSGPQGSLWGSEAIGGVIAITTREIDGWRAEAEVGSMATARGFAGIGTAGETYALSASVTGLRTDGVSKAASGREDDAFEAVTANLAGRLEAPHGVRLDGRLRYGASSVEIDGFPAPNYVLGDTLDRNKSRAWSGFGRAAFAAAGFAHQLSVSLYDLKRENISDFPSDFGADRQVLRWTAARGPVVVGAERQESSADLSGRVKEDLSVTSAFATGRLAAGPLTLTAAVRYDDPDHFDAKTTGRLSAAARLPAGFTLTAAAGQGFKIPSISQYACDFCFAPPVALRPEAAEGYDLRLGWRGERVAAAVTAYRLNVTDQIAYVAARYVNIARTRSEGIEAEVEAQLSDAVRLKGSYARTDAIDRTSGASLLRVPDHAASAALLWEEGRWSGAVTARAESSQADTDLDGFSPVTRKSFVTADVAAAYALNDRVTLTARLENLADRRYQETFGYGEPGRAVFVGVRLRN
ncbi:TonB-dependent receptor plug domain-containing protein [Phenylobacterium sp.]|jgi:vitamin B12 transporter|uniref:TonB-dependent receptor plug domain-containing protein n=1 Tax=Phenylobacterium sp. TaxID=1871053 RepID=UPI003782D788